MTDDTIEPRRHQVRELLAGEVIPDGASAFVPLGFRDAAVDAQRALRDAAYKDAPAVQVIKNGRRGRPTIRTDAFRAKFLAALADGLSVTNAAIAAGARRVAVYRWRKEDPIFAEEWDQAIEEGTDRLEDEARRRAMNGSDQLIMFLLRARRPAFRDRALHEHVGASGGRVQFAVEVQGAREELAARIEKIVARSKALGIN